MLDLRRAVMRILLRSDDPRSLAEIVWHLQDVDGIDVVPGRDVDPHHRISDLLNWQVRRGRVRRIRRGWFEVVPDSLSRTNRWRIEHWDRH